MTEILETPIIPDFGDNVRPDAAGAAVEVRSRLHRCPRSSARPPSTFRSVPSR